MTDDPRQPDENDETDAQTADEPVEDESAVAVEEPAPRRGSNRSLSLYAVLGVGVAALLVLLAIIYFSSLRNENPEQPICTTIDPASAQNAVRSGNVKRVVVNYDKAAQSPTDPDWGPVLSRIDYTNGDCANLPQGIQQRDAITLVLGTVYLYNEITSEPQIEIKLEGSDNLSSALFITPTPTPTATDTPVPSPTVAAAVTSPVAPAPTSISTPTPVPTRAASPDASPAASPGAATPESPAP